MRSRLACVAMLLLSVVGCASNTKESPPARVALSGNEITYHGNLDKNGVEAVRRLLEGNANVGTLVIESPGGELDLGMDLGELVHDRGLDVRVSGWGCASSCANYVFPAGRQKFIDRGSVVIWHGSAIQKHLGGIWLVLPAVRAYDRQVKARQRSFYNGLGVDARITILGQEFECRCLWTLVPGDMAEFGIRDVHASGDYGKEGPDWKRLGIQLIRLSEHPQYRASLRGAL